MPISSFDLVTLSTSPDHEGLITTEEMTMSENAPINAPSQPVDAAPPSSTPAKPPMVYRNKEGKPVPRVTRDGAPKPVPDTPEPSETTALPGGARRLDAPIVAQPPVQQGIAAVVAEQILPPEGEPLRNTRGGEQSRRDRSPRRPGPRRDEQPERREAGIFSHEFGFGKKALREDLNIDEEFAAAMGGRSTVDILGEVNASQPRRKPAEGETGPFRNGTVIRVQKDALYVSMPGSRAEGLLRREHWPEGETPVAGDSIEVRVEGYDGANGLVILAGKKTTAVDSSWTSMVKGAVVEGRVVGANKGGLEIMVGSIRAFMPMSQIDTGRVEQPEAWINQRIQALVTLADVADSNLVLSRRDLLDREREEASIKTWNELAEEQVRDGIVRSLQDYGAFVDLGGVDGLIPLREMAWARISHPSEILKVGDTVKVKVLKIDPETRKIALGLRQLMDNPWDSIASKLVPGTTVTGPITRLADFGAFVALDCGIEGLIHLSELAIKRVRRPQDAVKVGEVVDVIVLSIDTDLKRVSLSLKAAKMAAEGHVEDVAALVAESNPAPAFKPKARPGGLRGGTGGGGPLFSLPS
jgi:small subunit ribosomal protein S1